MKRTLAALITAITFQNAFSQQKVSNDLEVLKKLNEKFIHNFVTNDAVSHDKIMHKDFVYISSSGQYVDRAKYLADWKHGFDGIVYWDYRDERINIFGNVALVHAANKCIQYRNGIMETGMTVYTDTYIKENGEWKCIQAQISKVSPVYYPSDDTIVKKYDYRK